MVAAARGLGLSTVVMTGAHFQGLPDDFIQTLAIEPRAAWMVATPRLASRPSGTGDLFTALFAAALLEGLPTAAVLSRAGSCAAAVLQDGAGGFHGAPVAPRSPLRARPLSRHARMQRPGWQLPPHPHDVCGHAQANPSIGIGRSLELDDGLRAAGHFERRREHFIAELRL
jgi:hypothetical protein